MHDPSRPYAGRVRGGGLLGREVRRGAPVCMSLDTVHTVDTVMLGHACMCIATFATIGQKVQVISLAAAICQSVEQFLPLTIVA